MSISRSNSTTRNAHIQRLEVRPAGVAERVGREADRRDQLAREHAGRVEQLERELAQAAAGVSVGAGRCAALEGQLARQDAERRSLEACHQRQLEDAIHQKAVAEMRAACPALEHRPASGRNRMREVRWGLAVLAGMAVVWWVMVHLVVILVLLGLLALLAGGRR